MCGKGLELHRLHFGWSREELCCSFLKEKEKNLYHLPHFPGITSFGEFSNGYHFLFMINIKGTYKGP